MDLTTKQLHTENRYHCLSAQFSLSRLACTVASTLQLKRTWRHWSWKNKFATWEMEPSEEHEDYNFLAANDFTSLKRKSTTFHPGHHVLATVLVSCSACMVCLSYECEIKYITNRMWYSWACINLQRKQSSA